MVARVAWHLREHTHVHLNSLYRMIGYAHQALLCKSLTKLAGDVRSSFNLRDCFLKISIITIIVIERATKSLNVCVLASDRHK